MDWFSFIGCIATARNALRAHANARWRDRRAIFAEPMERRVLLSVFTLHMSTAPTGSLSSGVNLELWTTGGGASKITGRYNDPNNPNATVTYNAPPGGVPTPYQPPAFVYQQAGNYRIWASANLASNQAITSTTGIGLSQYFGTSPFQKSGMTSYPPTGATGNASGAAVAVDPTNGNIYSAHLYNGLFAVSRFLPPKSNQLGGVVDTTWGQSANTGTLVLNSFTVTTRQAKWTRP